MKPIQPERNLNGLISFEEFRDVIRTPHRTVRNWPQNGIEPRRTGFHRCGHHYFAVAQPFLRATSTRANRAVEDRSHG